MGARIYPGTIVPGDVVCGVIQDIKTPHDFMSLAIYRCKSCNKIIIPKHFIDHPGHTVVMARDGSFFEWVKVKWWQIRGDVHKRSWYSGSGL